MISQAKRKSPVKTRLINQFLLSVYMKAAGMLPDKFFGLVPTTGLCFAGCPALEPLNMSPSYNDSKFPTFLAKKVVNFLLIQVLQIWSPPKTATGETKCCARAANLLGF